MVDNEKAVVMVTAELIDFPETTQRYGDDLARAGMVADRLSRDDAFRLYHIEKSENTITAQCQGLHLFSTYLASAGVARSADDLFYNAEAWRGMSEGLVKGFRTWLVNAGYRIGSINHRLAIVRQYCTLAHDAGAIADEKYDLIMTVKGFSAKAGINVDRDRTREGKPQPSPVKRRCLPWC